MGRPAHAGAASTVALLYVRLGPKATELLRYRELPLCATSGLMQCSKRIHLDGLCNLYEPLLHELYRPCHRVSIHLDVRQQIVIDPAVRSRGSSA